MESEILKKIKIRQDIPLNEKIRRLANLVTMHSISINSIRELRGMHVIDSRLLMEKELVEAHKDYANELGKAIRQYDKQVNANNLIRTTEIEKIKAKYIEQGGKLINDNKASEIKIY